MYVAGCTFEACKYTAVATIAVVEIEANVWAFLRLCGCLFWEHTGVTAAAVVTNVATIKNFSERCRCDAWGRWR